MSERVCKKKIVGEKDSNKQMFVTREIYHIKFIGKRKCVQKKKEYIGGLKWGIIERKCAKIQFAILVLIF